MRAFAASILAAVIAASGSPPVRAGDLGQSAAEPAAPPVGEAYVAELDADWNVTREIRVPCPADAGCAVDLGLGDAGLAAVHVRFYAIRAGAVAVSSRLEDLAGRASPAEAETLALDRAGFAASHHDAAMAPGAPGDRIILMAVKMPGWVAPPARDQRT